MSLLSIASRLLLAPLRNSVLSAMQPLAGASRGRKGKVLAQAMWPGWPRFSPDGWPYARQMKRSKGKDYISKQEWRRQNGKSKGAQQAAHAPPFFSAAWPPLLSPTISVFCFSYRRAAQQCAEQDQRYAHVQHHHRKVTEHSR